MYDWIRLHDKTKMAKRKKNKQHDIPAPIEDVECDSNFEDNYGIDDDLDVIQKNQELAEDINFEDEEDKEQEQEQELKGGAHLLAEEEEEESEDELLLTTKSNKALKIDIEQFKQVQASKVRTKFLKFHPNHPQYNTHHVVLLDESQGLVPNFVGGAIPC